MSTPPPPPVRGILARSKSMESPVQRMAPTRSQSMDHTPGSPLKSPVRRGGRRHVRRHSASNNNNNNNESFANAYKTSNIIVSTAVTNNSGEEETSDSDESGVHHKLSSGGPYWSKSASVGARLQSNNQNSGLESLLRNSGKSSGTSNSNNKSSKGNKTKRGLSPSPGSSRLKDALARLDQQQQLDDETENEDDDQNNSLQKNLTQYTSSSTPAAPVPRRIRRPSISSMSSESSLSMAGTATEGSIDILGGGSISGGDNSGRDYSNPALMSLLHQSSVTLPATNIRGVGNNNNHQHATDPRQRMKTEQIIESLVWFSFHTPRAVMEDLIASEMVIWAKNQEQLHQKKELRRKKRQAAAAAADQSVSSLDDSTVASNMSEAVIEGKNFSESVVKLQDKGNNPFMKLPTSVARESALLFVDMSGFTKLSTMLDVESLSKVINAYFDMIVTEVINYGGDILKFAGDAFFAEWRVTETPDESSSDQTNPLAHLNASLASVGDLNWIDDEDVPKISSCALRAAQCACSIVAKYSDYHVTSASSNRSESMLNVHCGVGVGKMCGLHVGDYKDGQDDEDEHGVELRREFLILGEPIEQVSLAADVAVDGEVYASPETMLALAHLIPMTDEQRICSEPILIASRNKVLLDLEDKMNDAGSMKPYEALRKHCTTLNNTALARLHVQMALYVHPVIRSDELALSAAIQAGKVSQPTSTLESRQLAEAELRSVFTMFIKAVLSPKVTGLTEVDSELHTTLHDIMHVTSRELDRYSGHLRQFIVDDKGVVLIATFGLRGSTFPNMVSNNALPAAFAINRCLKNELNVENRIGCTFGKVYCGIVGGIRRHEFAVMGAPVNLAARLMCSKENRGILVDEAVRKQAGDRFAMNSLPPVKAKGYDNPVKIHEPLNTAPTSRRKKSVYPFTGRKDEKQAVNNVANFMLTTGSKSQSSMVFLTGESGMGKSSLATSVVEDIRKSNPSEGVKKKIIIAARSTSNETEQRIPLSSFRQIFLSIIRDHCEYDGSLKVQEDSSGQNNVKGPGGFGGANKQQAQRRLSLAPSRRRSLTNRSQHRPALSRSVHSTRQLSVGGQSGSSSSTPQKIDKRPSLMMKAHNLRVNATEFSEVTENSMADDSSNHGGKSFVFKSFGQFTQRGGESRGPGMLRGSVHGSAMTKIGEETAENLHGSRTDALSQSLHQLRNGEGGFSHHRSGRKSDPPSLLGTSLHRMQSKRGSFIRAPMKSQSVRNLRGNFSRNSNNNNKFQPDDSSVASMDSNVHRLQESVPYFEKLCWVCEKLDYPFEYADIVGSQFLGLEAANPVTHVDGHVPTMEELVDFLSQAFICLSEFADLSIVVFDDFQWADAFSWKIFRALCTSCKKMLLICASRPHDKQALRRLTTALAEESDLETKLTQIFLGPLDFGDIRDMIAMVLEVEKSAVTETICTDVFERTGGLPVFVVQTLENIKRKGTLELVGGVLKWNAEGLREKHSLSSVNNAAVMEESFLSRFDSLDVQVRKILQTCAVLGLDFALTDVIQVHPEIDENDIENSLDAAVEEMILVEHTDYEDELSASVADDDYTSMSLSRSSRSGSRTTLDDRYFQFSHAMWRENVLTTMLTERKYELHRLIAESMERDSAMVLVLEQNNIARLSVLFDHWKACGDFCKAAPIALAVGARLEEWDLSAQSLELYEDALELSFESVFNAEEEKNTESEWVQVKAKPMVLDLILRLHVCIGLCHQRLGDPQESILFFEDAYSIIKSASKIPGMSKALMMPIISSLCVLKLEEPATGDPDQVARQQDQLVEQLLSEARADGHPVHICRALAIDASREAQLGHFLRAINCVDKILESYDIALHGPDMIAEYGSDFALAAIADSVQWLYLAEQPDQAEDRADFIMDDLLSQLETVDIDDTMLVVLPLISVLMLLDRAQDADWLLKKYVINPYHESGQVSFWSPLFNPLAYVLEIILMEESEQYDLGFLEDLEAWVMEEDSYDFDVELERTAHTLMGELCWRLAYNKDSEDPNRQILLDKASDLLTPIAKYPHPDIFLKHTARALLEAL